MRIVYTRNAIDKPVTPLIEVSCIRVLQRYKRFDEILRSLQVTMSFDEIADLTTNVVLRIRIKI